MQAPKPDGEMPGASGPGPSPSSNQALRLRELAESVSTSAQQAREKQDQKIDRQAEACFPILERILRNFLESDGEVHDLCTIIAHLEEMITDRNATIRRLRQAKQESELELGKTQVALSFVQLELDSFRQLARKQIPPENNE